MASTAADDMRAKRRDGLYTNTEMLGIMAMVGVLTAVAVAYGSALLGAPVPPAINDAALAAAHAAHRAELATITSRMNDMAASMFDLRSALVKQLAREQPACNCPASSAAPSTAQPPHVATAFDSGAAVNARVTEANAPATEAVDTKLGHSTALPDIDSDGRPNRFGIDDLRDKFNVKVAHRVYITKRIRKILRRSTLTDGDADTSLNAAFEPYTSRAPAVGYRTEDMYALHYVRRADEPGLGYGLYAARALEAGTVLGEYTGELRELDLYTYAWLYPAEIKGDDETFLVIDATKRGNTLRFANDGGANSNCKAVYLSVNETWRVFYQTTRAVLADEALLIEYGAVDWQRIPLSETLEQEAERARHPLEEEDEEDEDDVEDVSDDDTIVYVPMRADREIAAMLAQADNATFVAETNARRGIRSPFRRFSVPEMPAAFNVTLLRANEVSAATRAELEVFNLDLSYASSKTEMFAPYLADEPELRYRETELEKSYYIRWSSDARGHGLFAARDLPAEYVIGQYTGVLELSQGDSLYAWAYFATPKNGTELDEDFYYHVDSRHRGNALRFVNDERGLWNTRQEQVPHKNMWHIFYVTTRAIKQDEELFVSYGDDYWSHFDK